MAVGFTPKDIQYLRLEELSQPRFLALAHEAAKTLHWRVDFVSSSGMMLYTDNGMFSWNAEITIRFEGDKVMLKSSSTGTEMVDWGKNKKNVDRLISEIEYLHEKLSETELDTIFQEIEPSLSTVENDILSDQSIKESKGVKGALAMFIPTKGYYFTPLIVIANIVLFALMILMGGNILTPDTDTLIVWGGNARYITLAGEWWRLFTNVFLHIGIVHLIFNMYALIFIGLLLEPLLGKWKFIAAYLITGIFASITSIWWHENSISAGASGAIFGLYGIFLALLLTNLIEKNRRNALLSSIGIFVFYNLAMGVKEGIDNAAHIGGLLSGFILGFGYYFSLKDAELARKGKITMLVALLFVACSGFVLIKQIPNALGRYVALMKEFDVIEQEALTYYNIEPNSLDYVFIDALKKQGIPNWEKGIKVLNSADSIEGLTPQLKSNIALLKRYCGFRINCYKLMAKAIKEKTVIYDNEIIVYNQKIELIIKKISGVDIPDSLLNYDETLVPKIEDTQKLIVVNGQIVDSMTVNPKDITSMVNLSPDEAVATYGERGANGAIIINTKN